MPYRTSRLNYAIIDGVKTRSMRLQTYERKIGGIFEYKKATNRPTGISVHLPHSNSEN